MLVGPKGHRVLRQREVSFRALDGVALCGPVQPNAMTSVMAELAQRQGVTLDFVLEGSSSAILREAVARCGLCAVFPRPFVKREMAGAAYASARITKPGLEQLTWLAVGTQRPATLAARTVARLVCLTLTGR